jgi:hypothetical protein
MTGRLDQFLALPPAERATLLRALVWLPLVALQLRLRGFDAASRVARRVGARSDRAPDPRATARLVATAARHGLHRGNCLSQSLTLQRLLARNGIAAELRIGARRAGEKLEAHAWVEHEGRPLNDGADVAQRFPPFDLRSPLPPLV